MVTATALFLAAEVASDRHDDAIVSSDDTTPVVTATARSLLAAEGGHTAVARLLRRHGADKRPLATSKKQRGGIAGAAAAAGEARSVGARGAGGADAKARKSAIIAAHAIRLLEQVGVSDRFVPRKGLGESSPFFTARTAPT